MRIDPETEELWRSYLQAERDRVRGVFLPALERFLDRFLKEPEAGRNSWAKEVAAAAVDWGEEIPVRCPLLRRALLPALADCTTSETTPCRTRNCSKPSGAMPRSPGWTIALPD